MMQKAIVIAGPTAAGKTALSIDIAHEIDGEIISADSRQVYRGLDIGSSKITPEEMQGVPHHLLNVADPKKTFAVSDFIRFGRRALDEIEKNRRMPLIVGGTGFYIDALLGRNSPAPVSPNQKLREELNALPVEKLIKRLEALDENYAKKIDRKNKRRVVRAIEIIDALGFMPRPTLENLCNTLWIGLTVPFPTLREKIKKRMDIRLSMGMLDEARTLHQNGISYERMEEFGLEYRLMAEHMQGKINLAQLKERIENESMAYAKRQMTWFKRNKSMHWFDPKQQEQITAMVKKFMTK